MSVIKTFILPADRPADRDRIARNASNAILALPGNRAHQVRIELYRKPRTDPQNAALFGVAYPPLMDHIGLRGAEGREELHEYFCGEYFGWVRHEILGKVKQRPLRTTTRNEHGQRDVIPWNVFTDFYALVQQRGADEGITIPDPDPMLRKVAA